MRKAVTDNAALVGASAVLTGNVVNVSIFKEVWLERHDIIRKDEYTSDTLVSPGAVRISTASFELTILLNRIQLRFLPPGYDRAKSDVLRVLGGIAELLPHTPYTGLGLNFHYVLAPPAGGDFWQWNPAVFAAPWALAIDKGDGGSPRFGS